MNKKVCIGAAMMIFTSIMAAPAFALDEMEMLSMPVTQISPMQQGNTGAILPGQYEMISFFQVEADEYYEDMGYSSNHYEYKESELMELAKVIHLEVRGESYEAMLAVGNVVMNRVLSPGYPGDTIEEVISRPNQFAYKPSVQPNEICIKAARDVLEREVWVVPQNIYYFKVSSQRDNWGAHKYYKHIGATAFYRDSYSGRSDSSSVPAALHKRIYKWPQYGCAPGLRVIQLKIMLNSLGFKVNTDGYFDMNTRNVLIQYQKSAGLKQTGVADPATLSKMLTKFNSINVLGLKCEIS